MNCSSITTSGENCGPWSPRDVNKYLREAAGDDFTAKDFLHLGRDDAGSRCTK